MDRDEEAEATLRAVIDAAPAFAKPAEDLGYLLLPAEACRDALPFLERATQLDPCARACLVQSRQGACDARPRPDADAAFEKPSSSHRSGG